MKYLNKTTILAGLLLSINGFLHSSDNASGAYKPIEVQKKVSEQTKIACKLALEEVGLTYLEDSKPLINPAVAIGLEPDSLKGGGTITMRLERIETLQTNSLNMIINMIGILIGTLHEGRINTNLLINQINDLKESIARVQASQDAHDSITRAILDPDILQEDPMNIVEKERENFLPKPIPVTPLPYTEEDIKNPKITLDSLIKNSQETVKNLSALGTVKNLSASKILLMENDDEINS